MFCERAKLFRWAEATKEWKERGLGDIKILSNADTGKKRILMRREKTLKLCANHYVTADIKMKIKADCEKAVTWAAPDYADGEMVREKFTIKFKTPEMAQKFKETVEKAQESLNESGVNSTSEETKAPESTKPSTAIDLSAKTSSKPAINNQANSLAAMFKPPAGSWSCSQCLVTNKPEVTTCIACQGQKEGTVAPAGAASTTPSQSTFSFGIKSSTAASTPPTGFQSSTFKFGVSSPATTFSFGLPASTPQSSTPSVSIIPIDSSKVSTGPKTPPPSSEPPTGFKFGSPDKFEFSFKPKSPRSRDVSQCESEEGIVDEDDGEHLYFEVSSPMHVEVPDVLKICAFY